MKKMEHYYRTIQGWSSFIPLYTEMVAAAKPGAVFVEVGAWRGRSAAYMGVEIMNSGKPIEFHVVDHWLGSAEHVARAEPSVVNGTLYEEFIGNMKPLLKAGFKMNIHRDESVRAAATFPDDWIDFLLIDGSHDADSVSADLAAWTPKVKPGGVIAGDDYSKPGVRQAVMEWHQIHGTSIELFGGISKSGFRKCWRSVRP